MNPHPPQFNNDDEEVAFRQATERAKKKELDHIGIHSERLAYSDCLSTRRENAFAAQWKYENETHSSAIYYGGSLLQGLLLKGPCDPFSGFGGDRRTAVHIIEQRDAEIVATVIQWLGTNVGFDFVRQSLERAGYKLVEPPYVPPEVPK